MTALPSAFVPAKFEVSDSRRADQDQWTGNAEKAEQLVTSVGTKGHPSTCGVACRYVRRKHGCRDGAACPNCHECHWRRGAGTERAGNEAMDELKRLIVLQLSYVEGAVPPTTMSSSKVHVELVANKEEQAKGRSSGQAGDHSEVFAGVVSADDGPVTESSVGSLGHPYDCNEPCKYFRRKAGCRDGWQCLKCHRCEWVRKPTRKPVRADESGALAGFQPGAVMMSAMYSQGAAGWYE